MLESEIRATVIRELSVCKGQGLTPAFSYDRISDENQDDGLSLAYQAEGARRYAQEHELALVYAFTIIESASKQGRKVFNLMIDLALQCGVKNLIFKNTDRMSRNYYDLVRIEKLIDEHNFEIHFFQSNLVINRSSNYNDRFLLGIQLAVAKHTSDKISQDVKEHNSYKLKKGIAPFKSPLGYRYDMQAKCHIIDKDAEAMCRLIFDRFDFSAISLSELVDELNAAGYTTQAGYKWVKSSLHYLLSNPFYHGEFEFQKRIWPGTHQPYYPKSRFEQRKTRLANRHVGKRKRDTNFALARIVRCTCGGLFSGDLKKQKYVYYKHYCTTGMKPFYIREEVLLQAVDSSIWSLEFKTNALRLLTEELTAHARSVRAKDSGQTQSLRRQIASLKRKKDRLLELYAEDEIDKNTLLVKVGQLTEQVNRLEAEANRANIQPRAVLEHINNAAKTILDLPKIYRQAEPVERATILKTIAREIEVNEEDQRVRIVWKEPMRYLLVELKPEEISSISSGSKSSYCAPEAGFEPATR